jgi:hypothetical protein
VYPTWIEVEDTFMFCLAVRQSLFKFASYAPKKLGKAKNSSYINHENNEKSVDSRNI